MRWLLYRPLMKLAHRFGWHHAPALPLTNEYGWPLHRCAWCGLSGFVFDPKRAVPGPLVKEVQHDPR